MAMNIDKFIRALPLAFFALIAACGGGGSGEAGAPPFGGGGGGGGTGISDLSLNLNRVSVPNSGGETVTVTVTAVDSNRNALANTPVQISADNGAVVVAGGTSTADNGTLAASVGIGSDKSNRLITVRAVSGGIERTAAFQVVGARIESTPLPAVVATGSTNNKVDYRLIDAAGNPMTNTPIAVEASGLPTASGVTGANGEYSYAYTAPAVAGVVNVTARGGGATVVTAIEVISAGGGGIPPASGTVLSGSVSANPSVVAVNQAGSTVNRSEIRALFLGAANAPIRNVRVKFDLAGDPNSIGGTFSSGTNLVYSDADGVATVSYAPGTRSSPTDGVTIRACYGNTDVEANSCARFATATLTVTSEPLSVTIGFNNEILSGEGGLVYIRNFVVQVVDASGKVKPDVVITPSIDIVQYYKGSLALSPSRRATCLNEDLNRNGVLESGEDINFNGQLDPRKADISIRVLGTGRTNESGLATVQIVYPENVGLWLRYRILVSASGIAGTEGRAAFEDDTAVSTEDLNGEGTPAFFNSPYGRAASCTDPN
jgi:hypothetical protein